MKILVVGKNSYIGTSFMNWIKKNGRAEIDVVESENDVWRDISFDGYDTVVHVAGIAHVSRNPKYEGLYYKVNRDLSIAVAQKAKDENVKQFIFMSSIIVYGDDTDITNEIPIDRATKPVPANFYGKSKLEAEYQIYLMQSSDFHVAIVRCPVVYGPNCKGNFVKLIKMAKLLFLIPDINNTRSMIFIDNLCAFLSLIIEKKAFGVFFPQNNQYVSMKSIITSIRSVFGKKTYTTTIFNSFILVLSKRVRLFRKIFGNKFYAQDISFDSEIGDYTIVSFEESIRLCVKE